MVHHLGRGRQPGRGFYQKEPQARRFGDRLRAWGLRAIVVATGELSRNPANNPETLSPVGFEVKITRAARLAVPPSRFTGY